MPEPRRPLRLLITGADGFVGRVTAHAAAAAGMDVAPLGRVELDITDPTAVAAALGAHAPVVVLNAAAFTNNDLAEREPARAHAVNALGPGNLARACAARGIRMVHLSTDSVFGAVRVDPAVGHREDDKPAPRSVYGATKLAGEQAVAAALAGHVIVRLSWLFGAGDKTFVGAVTRRALAGPEIRVVEDQIGCPTPVETVGAALVATIGQLARDALPAGVLHFCANEAVTRLALAAAILDVLRGAGRCADRRIVPVPAAELDTAPRPLCSVLDCSRLTTLTGLGRPAWRPALREVVLETAGMLAAGRAG